MPTSAPGSSGCNGNSGGIGIGIDGAGRDGPCSARRWRRGTASASRNGRGFTLIELLVVIAIVALSAGIVSLSLRDPDAARLEEEGERLVTLLESARADARVSGIAVQFHPSVDPTDSADAGAQFRFVGLPASRRMPQRWLDPRTSAQVVGAPTVVLGPDAILPPQRLLLRLGDRRLEIATDGLGPFATAPAATP